MNDDYSDRDLWEAAAGGQSSAFGILFRRHARAVYNHCFRRTADWSVAEDLTSLVFCEAWRRRTEVVLDRESALPWLLGVANGVVANQRWARRRYAAAVAKVPPPPNVPDPADDVAGRLDDQRRMVTWPQGMSGTAAVADHMFLIRGSKEIKAAAQPPAISIGLYDASGALLQTLGPDTNLSVEYGRCWLDPAKHIVLGRTDLDPTSCAEAQPWVAPWS